MKRILNYIDGSLTPGSADHWLDIYDPSTGKVYAKAPDSGHSDVEAATAAARRAYPEWSGASIEFRYAKLMKIVSLIEEHFEELAIAESIDNGKPLWLTKKVDIPRAKSNFEFFATAIKHFSTNAHEMTGEAVNYTLRHPLGVVGCISPWNLPLYLLTWKIAPALAAGNCVVAKPSEVTPMTAYLLGKICIKADLPRGVLNIVHGLGHKVGAALTAHRDIKAISFTGSTLTGEAIAKTAAPMFKKLSLEMGGKNPNIIFADCDFDKMMNTTIQSSFANQGQICLCGSRIFVESPIYEKFKKEFVKRVSALKVGAPAQADTEIGAVVSEAHMNKILGYIDLAKEEGGSILCGGQRLKLDGAYTDGYFIAPTVIENLSYDCRVNQEEIFGPVVTIMPFDTEEEVLKYANSTVYGLAAILWTSELSRAHRMAERLDAGIVWINTWLLRDLRTPFGGVKNSGVGREGGWEALRFFTEPKNVCIAY
jgi:aminomuconate-semialdehyde/2-hydroxymuconate-6-semialdehyde dehydrogenase